LMICLFALTEFTNVTDVGHTDKQTDKQTPHDDIGRACIASHGKNYNRHVITIFKTREVHYLT